MLDSGCHEWTGHVMVNGYGQISRDGKPAYSHRVRWEMANGIIENGDYVLHSCDNRKCVNIDHLFVGTFYDNMDDMVRKGRQACGVRNSHAKLTDEKILEIRSANGTQEAIASNYGVTRSLISMIRNKKIWRHV